jgi:hypothetical protein
MTVLQLFAHNAAIFSCQWGRVQHAQQLSLIQIGVIAQNAEQDYRCSLTAEKELI